MPVARLDRHRGTDSAIDVAEPLLDPLLLAGFRGGERGEPLGAFARVVIIRQRPARLGRIGLDDIGVGRRRDVGQRAQRQAVADRTVAWNQMQRAAAGLPFLAAPAMLLRLRLPALDRQHVSGRLGQAAREDAGNPVTLLRILELGVFRRDVRRAGSPLSRSTRLDPRKRARHSRSRRRGRRRSRRGAPAPSHCVAPVSTPSTAMRLGLSQIGLPSRRQ